MLTLKADVVRAGALVLPGGNLERHWDRNERGHRGTQAQGQAQVGAHQACPEKGSDRGDRGGGKEQHGLFVVVVVVVVVVAGDVDVIVLL